MSNYLIKCKVKNSSICLFSKEQNVLDTICEVNPTFNLAYPKKFEIKIKK